MEELRVASRPSLRRPVLITAFRGWNDGGQGASLAAGFLARNWQAARFADIDPEEFFDFQATRPHVSLVDGVTRQVDWPDNAFYHAEIPGTDRDAMLLLGIEPNVRWRTFTTLVAELATDLGVELVGHARLAPRRRAAHASVARDRERERLGARGAPRAAGVALRGPDRDRRRAARRVQAGGHPVGEPLGGCSALRVARAEPSRRARALPPPRRAARRGDRHHRARGGERGVRAAGERGRRVRSRDGCVRRGARAAHRGDRGGRGEPARRATRSPPS